LLLRQLMISEAFLLAKIPVTAQAMVVMGLERVVAMVATKVAQVMDLRAVVAMDLALDPLAVMGLLAVAIMVEVMDQAVMVDQAQARPAAMDPQAVAAMEVLAAAEAAQTETMEAMVVVAPVAARTVEVAVMGLEPVGAMDMVQLADLAAAAMELVDLPAAVATEQVRMAMEVMDPAAMVVMDPAAMVVMDPAAMVVMDPAAVVVMDPVAATVKVIRCQTQFSPKAVIIFNV